MNAVISGQAGVALLVDGSKLSSVHANRPDEIIRRVPREIPYLLGDAKDLQFLKNVDVKEACRRLDLATSQMDALHIVLILLDKSLTDSTRQEATKELEKYLENEAISVFVENVLFAHRLPPDADIIGAQEQTADEFPRAQKFLNRLGSLQRSISVVQKAWDQIPDAVFGSNKNRLGARTVAVREGVFRSLVLRHELLPGMRHNVRFSASFVSYPGFRAISHEWLKLLYLEGDLGGWTVFLEKWALGLRSTTRIFNLATAGVFFVVMLIVIAGAPTLMNKIESKRRAAAEIQLHEGEAHLREGDLPAAAEAFGQASMIYKEIDNSREELAGVSVRQAKVYQKMRLSEKAIYAYQDAIDLSRAIGDRQLEAKSLAGMGVALCQAKEYDKSLSALRRAQELAASLHSLQEDGEDASLGLCVGKIEGSRRQAGIGLKGRIAPAAALLANAYAVWHEGNIDDALGRAREAAKAVDNLTAEERKSLRASSADWGQDSISDLLIQLYMEKHRRDPYENNDIEAFKIYEDAIARSAADARIAAFNVHEAVHEAQPEPFPGSSVVNVMFPRVAPSPQDIQEKVLDSDTILLEFYLGEPRSFLWLISKGSVESFELASRSYLEGEIRSAISAVSSPSPRAQVWVKMKLLSNNLLGSVAERLTNKRLLIVAPGPLAYFPFAALPFPGSSEVAPLSRWGPCLILEHEIFTAPSASTWLMLREKSPNRRPARLELAVLADPVVDSNDPRLKGKAILSKETGFSRLPGSRREAEEILALVPKSESLAAFGFDANLGVVLSGVLQDYRFIHFATHSTSDNEEPLLSSLVLSQFNPRGEPIQGKLRAVEIPKLDLSSTDLVVLSACASARSRSDDLLNWEELALPSSFLKAGAANVLFSTWEIRDQAAATLMARFYRALLLEKRTIPEALRQSQLELLTNSEYSAPYYWAGFALQGDWV